jgi:hypothetical protein
MNPWRMKKGWIFKLLKKVSCTNQQFFSSELLFFVFLRWIVNYYLDFLLELFDVAGNWYTHIFIGFQLLEPEPVEKTKISILSFEKKKKKVAEELVIN